MATLKNHPNFWLRDDAAAAFNAYEAKHGVISVNSAGRTVAQQNELIRRWHVGGKYNRPPYLYRPSEPAPTSNHVANGGVAVDVSDYNRFKQHSADFGFHWYGSSDPVHFTFKGWNGGGGGSGASTGSEQVRQQQVFLASRGYDIGKTGADGIIGPKYRAAVKAYQQYLKGRGWYGGGIDGIWGSGTQDAHAKFWNELNAAPSTPSGTPTYAQIQAALNKFGYGLAVDGIWGRGSSNSLADFQRKNGLVVDRMVGPATRAKLGI